MGKGIVEELKKDFPLQDEWVSYELHPEFPPEGVPLAKRFPDLDLKKMYDRLRAAGAPYGIMFGDVKVTSNSRLALEASEFARDQGHFHSFHDRVFRAFFSDTRDIGDLDVILELAERDGLNREELRSVLDQKHYSQRLDRAHEEGRQLGITGVPTFFLGESEKIVGAQPLDIFRKRLSEIQERAEA